MARRRTPYRMTQWAWLPVLIIFILAGLAILFLKLSDYVSCQGVIEPGQIQPLFSPSTGTIEFCIIEEGVKVSEGERLLSLDSRYEENTLKLQQQDLAAFQRNLDSLLEKRTLQEEQIKSILINADFKRDVNRNLFEGKSISSYEYDQNMYEIDQEEMNLLRTRLSLKIDIQDLRDRIESMKLQIERQQAILDDLTLMAPSSGTLILTETIYRDPKSVNFFSIQPGTVCM